MALEVHSGYYSWFYVFCGVLSIQIKQNISMNDWDITLSVIFIEKITYTSEVGLRIFKLSLPILLCFSLSTPPPPPVPIYTYIYMYFYLHTQTIYAWKSLLSCKKILPLDFRWAQSRHWRKEMSSDIIHMLSFHLSNTT